MKTLIKSRCRICDKEIQIKPYEEHYCTEHFLLKMDLLAHQTTLEIISNMSDIKEIKKFCKDTLKEVKIELNDFSLFKKRKLKNENIRI